MYVGLGVKGIEHVLPAFALFGRKPVAIPKRQHSDDSGLQRQSRASK